MTWFVYVVMVGMFADGTNDTFLYTKPTHETLEQCQAHVRANGIKIRQDMYNQFNGKMIDNVYCIDEEKLKKFFEAMDEEEKKSI